MEKLKLYIVIGMVGVIVLTMIVGVKNAQQSDQQRREYKEIQKKTCERYKDYTIEKLPVKCLEYFQVNKLLSN